MTDESTSLESQKKSALFVATLASFLTPFMAASVNVALPSIGETFKADAVILNWIATVFLLSSAMFLLPFGRIADIYGRKRIFAAGMIVVTISSLLLAIAPTIELLLAFRVLQGIGSAMIFGTGVAIVTSVFPRGERGKALGVTIAAVYSGLSLGPFAGGLLTEHLGWRSTFAVNVPLGLVVIYSIFWKLKGEWAAAKGEKFDLIGSVIYAVSLAIMVYGVSLIPKDLGTILALSGIAGLVVFVFWELRVEYPVFEMRLLTRNIVFAMSNLAAMLQYSASYGVTFLLSLYLQYIQGLDPTWAGLILVSRPVVMAIFSPGAGKLSDRFEPRYVVSTGMAIVALGLLLLSFVGSETGLWYIISSLALLGFGFAHFSSPNMNAIVSSVEKRYYGVAAGTAATMRLLGQMFSMATIMLIFTVQLGRVEITPEVYEPFVGTVQTAFRIFTVLCVVGIFASMARGKLGSDSRKNNR